MATTNVAAGSVPGMRRTPVRWIVWIVIGIVIAVAVDAVLVFVGYFCAYSNNPVSATVHFFGISIYELRQIPTPQYSVNQYAGNVDGIGMMVTWVVFIVIVGIIGEALWHRRQRSQAQR